jgi:hypothetical protein
LPYRAADCPVMVESSVPNRSEHTDLVSIHGVLTRANRVQTEARGNERQVAENLLTMVSSAGSLKVGTTHGSRNCSGKPVCLAVELRPD